MRKPRLSIVGTGYVGLCTAVGFASGGFNVIASTRNVEKAALINRGVPPFFEPGLQKPLKKAVEDGYLKCAVTRKEAVLGTDVTFVAVGTPSLPTGGIDLQYVRECARDIGKALEKKDSYHLIVVKSTVVPGTTKKVVKPIVEEFSRKNCGGDFGLCMNPEFLREGSALYDSLHPDRIVIGEFDRESGDILDRLYKEFYGKQMPPQVRTCLTTAELIKYVNNSFLATKISFINEIANICSEISDVDVEVVAEGIGLDGRINPLFLNAGLGYGGSCFPKDVKALICHSKTLGYDAQLLKAVTELNERQPDKAVEMAKKIMGNLNGKRVAVLGLAFKPNTDDMREAVSVKIVNRLLNEGCEVVAYDPAALSNARAIFEDRIEYAASAIECLRNADCCLLTTEWEEFKKLKPEDFTGNMNQPILIDGRRIYNPKHFSRTVTYAAIGLGPQ